MKLTLWGVLLLTHCYAHIAISEIGHNPLGSESASPGGISHEFIELINLSQDTIDLAGAYLTDGSTQDSLRAWQKPLYGLTVDVGTTSILPGQIAVVLDPDYADQHRDLPLEIPDGTLLLTIQHQSLLGGLTSSEGVALILNDTVAAYLGTKSSQETYTTESSGVDKDGSSIYPTSLINNTQLSYFSAASPGAIPNKENLSFFEVAIHESSSTIQLSVTILDWGISHKKCSIESGAEIRFDTTLHSFSTIISSTIKLPSPPLTLLLDTRAVTLNISDYWVPYDALVITEVNPRGTEEFIELYNQSRFPLNLQNYMLSVGYDTIVLPHIELNPQKSFTISESHTSTSETSLKQALSLDNYEDTVKLYYQDTLLDLFSWDSHWFLEWPEGFSLHRINTLESSDSTNLHLAPTSPLEYQDFLHISASKISLSTSPRLLIAGKDSVAILLSAPLGTDATLRIFSMEGYEVLSTKITPDTPFYWLGKKPNGHRLPTGPYLCVCTFVLDSRNGVVRSEVVLWHE